jgi:hypothetical protein
MRELQYLSGPPSLSYSDRPRPVGTPVRWEWAVHREGRAAVSFEFFDKRIYFLDVLFLITKLVLLLLPRRGHGGTYCDCLQFLSSEERRHSMKIGVSIGAHGRRVPGPTFALKCPK